MFPKVLLNIPQIICYSPNGATLNKLKTVYTFKESFFLSSQHAGESQLQNILV